MRCVKTLLLFVLVIPCLSFTPTKYAIQWQFKNFSKLVYHFEQITEDLNSGGNMPGLTWAKRFKGILTVTVKNGKYADVEISNVTTADIYIEGTDTSYTADKPLGNMFARNINFYGTKVGEMSDGMQLLLPALFPATDKKITRGETADIPFSVPSVYNNRQVTVNGYSRLQVISSNYGYAYLETEWHATEPTLPDDLKGKVSCAARGTSNYMFDLVTGCFTDGNISILTSLGSGLPGTGTVSAQQTVIKYQLVDGSN